MLSELINLNWKLHAKANYPGSVKSSQARVAEHDDNESKEPEFKVFCNIPFCLKSTFH